MVLRRWLATMTLSLSLALGASLPASKADEPPPGGDRLGDFAEVIVGIISQKVEELGDKVHFKLTKVQDESGMEFTLVPEPNALGPDVPMSAADFLGNLVELRVTYKKAEERVRLRVEMNDWTGVRLKELKKAKKNELVAIGVPRVARYTLRLDGPEVVLAADSSRKAHALRLHPHSRIGNIWFRELHVNPDTLKGRVNLGIAGNAIGIKVDFEINPEAEPGELPIIVKPDTHGTLKENAAGLLLVPFLAILLLV